MISTKTIDCSNLLEVCAYNVFVRFGVVGAKLCERYQQGEKSYRKEEKYIAEKTLQKMSVRKGERKE